MIIDGRTLRPPLWWKPGDPGTRPRKNIGTRARPVAESPSTFVWHWTGGSGRFAAGVYRTLRARVLSVHFIVEPGGRTVQCADPLTTVCYHAGSANGRAIGCETCGGPKADFTPQQYAAIAELAEAMPIKRAIFGSPHPGRPDKWETFAGHLEHHNIRATKPDDAGRVLRFLAARWGLPPPLYPR